MTAIEKQIQAAEKRIEKFEKNVNMYRERADKKLAMLQKNGLNVTRSDFSIFKTGRWKYDYDYTISEEARQILNMSQYWPVVDNLLKEQENIARLEDERKELEAKLEEIQTKNNLENERSERIKPLYTKFEEVLKPYKETWTKNMMDWHAGFYVRIHQGLPNARKQYDELTEKISRLYRLNGYKPNAQIKQHEAAKATFGRILSAAPVRYDKQEDYLKKVTEDLKQEWISCLNLLAEKCLKFNLGENFTVKHPQIASRGFDVLIQDRPDRVVDARIIWAAENSEYMAPHTRYIVTERNIQVKEEQKFQVGDRVNYPPENTEAEVMEEELEQFPKKQMSIENITVIGQKTGNLQIRCKVDGVQQCAKPMTTEEIKEYDRLKKEGNEENLKRFLENTAQKYFTGTQTKTQGLKR